MDLKDVENLARLVRIELKEGEKEKILSDMKSILEYVKQIEDEKAEEVEGQYNTTNIWREDELWPREFSKELIVEQFPSSEGGFLKVKKIL